MVRGDEQRRGFEFTVQRPGLEEHAVWGVAFLAQV